MNNGSNDQGFFRYLRQPAAPYPVHFNTLMLQLRESERRRSSMTPGTSPSPRRLRTTVRRHNVRYADLWSNYERYPVSRSNIIHSLLLRSSNNEVGNGSETGISQVQVVNQDNMQDQVRNDVNEDDDLHVVPSSEENVLEQAISEDYEVGMIQDELVPQENLQDQQASTSGTVASTSKAATNQNEPDDNSSTVYDASTDEEDFAFQPSVHPASSPEFILDDSDDEYDVEMAAEGTTSNIFVNNDLHLRNLARLLHINVEEALPHLFRTTPYRGTIRSGTRQDGGPIFRSNPNDLEMAAIDAIQRFENHMQGTFNGHTGANDPQAIENVLLTTMKTIFPVFTLHPNLIIEFQMRALEYDASKSVEIMKELSPARALLPEELGEACIICLIDFASDHIVRVLVCKHMFHGHCIDTWCKTSLTCPVCRGNVDGTGPEDAANAQVDPLATLRGLEFVRSYLVRIHFNRNDPDKPGPSNRLN